MRLLVASLLFVPFIAWPTGCSETGEGSPATSAADSAATPAGPDAQAGGDGEIAGDTGPAVHTDVDVMSGASEIVDVSAPDTAASDAGEPLPDTAQQPDVQPEPDVQLDGGADAGEPPPPPELPYVDRCSEPGDGEVNVYDLQDPLCPDHPVLGEGETQDVTLTGTVVTAVFSDQLFIQEPGGGPYAGINVFALTNAEGDPYQQLVPGDVVTVAGSYREFFGLSQVYADYIEKTGETDPLAPELIPDSSLVATGGPWAEPYEACLVKVEDVGVINTKPDCPHDFGEFVVEGDLRIDDLTTLEYTPHLGDLFDSVTGPLNYTFGNFKLEPRSMDDLSLIKSGGTGLSKCIEADCIEAPDAEELGALVVTEIMADPFGEDPLREWFEVQNRSAAAILLAGVTVKDCALQSWVIPLETAVALPPGGFAVIGASTNKGVNGGVDMDAAWGDGYYLPNGEGAVLLYNEVGQLLDQARYASYEPWDFETGRSQELVDPAANNVAPANWKATNASKYGDGGHGTPGEPNSTW